MMPLSYPSSIDVVAGVSAYCCKTGCTTIATLTVSLKEQASQIQKVSAQLELNKPAPQVVVNNQ